MNKYWFYIVLFALAGCTATPSLQEYYVSKSEDPNFLVIDIPTSILGINKSNLTDEEKEALDSFQKLNVLMFRRTTINENQLPEELDAVRSIIDSKRFDPLLIMSDRQYSGKLVLQGTVDAPNEIVFFGSADEGFLLARLIGRDMQVEKAMLLANIIKRGDGLEDAVKAIGRML